MNTNLSKAEKVALEVDKLNEAYELRHSKYFPWIKNIVTLAIGFLGIIVSLKSGKSVDLLQHIFFIITISSLVIGILFGVIVLYSEIYLLNQKRKLSQENLNRVISDKEKIKLQAINRPKIFDISEYCCFAFLILSLVTLVIYSSLSDYEITKTDTNQKITIKK